MAATGVRGRWDLLVVHLKPTIRKITPTNDVARLRDPATDRQEAVIQRRILDLRREA
jgi:hypothetical protein